MFKPALIVAALLHLVSTPYKFLGMSEISIEKGGSKWVQGPDGLGTLTYFLNILEHVYKWKRGYKLPKKDQMIINMTKNFIFVYNFSLNF